MWLFFWCVFNMCMVIVFVFCAHNYIQKCQTKPRYFLVFDIFNSLARRMRTLWYITTVLFYFLMFNNYFSLFFMLIAAAIAYSPNNIQFDGFITFTTYNNYTVPPKSCDETPHYWQINANSCLYGWPGVYQWSYYTYQVEDAKTAHLLIYDSDSNCQTVRVNFYFIFIFL